jgi:uridylate kinase
MPGGGCVHGRLVVKVSGSLVSPPEQGYLSRFASTIRRLVSSGCRLVVVTGGGPLARDYIRAARSLGVPEALLDVIGIYASRLNALTLASVLQPLAPLRVPTSIEEAATLAQAHPVVVMGGLQPGQSTNAVAAAAAEALGARVLVNMLRGVDGVYTPYPGAPGARRLERLTYGELWRLLEGAGQEAGGYALFDHVAISIVRRSSILVYFVNGEEPEVLEVIAAGESAGSLVGP